MDESPRLIGGMGGVEAAGGRQWRPVGGSGGGTWRSGVTLAIELTARFVVLAACMAQMLAGLAVLLRQAVATRPAPTARVDGPLGYVNFAGLAGFVLAGATVAITGAGAFAGDRGVAGDAARAVGVAVLGSAGLLAWAGIRAMGRHLVAPAEVRPDTELVTSGPFALVRHPLYDSILLLWIGGALALLSPVLAVVAVALAPAIHARAVAEERLLASHFGREWSAYSARVPMFVPRLRRNG
jgi:protein-S-isoprenylcysteine O-methyltransferase Ste14